MDTADGSSSTDTSAQEDIMRQKAMYEKEKGNNSFNSGRYQEAIEHYTNGIRCNPTEPTILCNRAMAYLKLRQYAKAKIDCDLAVALDPTYVKAIYRRALAHLGMDDKEAARSNFQRVLELEPSNRQALDELKKLDSKSPDQVDGQRPSGVAASLDDPLRVTPVTNPPNEWKTQPMTRITNIEEVTSSVARTSIMANGVDQSVDVQKREQLAKEQRSAQKLDELEVPPVPATSFEFFSRWGTMRQRNTGAVFEKYFMNIPPESYRDLFGRLIESDILSDVIRAFRNAIQNDANDHETLISVSKRLMKLSQLERFQVAYGFLDDVDKQAVKSIVTKLKDFDKMGQGDQEFTDLILGLKTAFEI